MEADQTGVRASMIETARMLQSEARAARERARQMLADDRARRTRIRDRSRTVDASAPPRPVLRIDGEIDVATAPAFVEALHVHLQAGEPGTELIVDLTALTFIDVRGLAALLTAADAARSRGTDFRVVGRPRCLLRLVELTDTRGALNIE